MADERCKHDLLIATCYDCSGRALEEQQAKLHAWGEQLSRPGWFQSRYPGKCPRCGEWFELGQPIRRASDDSAWVCCEADT